MGLAEIVRNSKVISAAGVLFRMAKDSWYGPMRKGSVLRRESPAWSVGGLHTEDCQGKAGNCLLQQFLVNCDVPTDSKCGLEGLHGPLFLLHEKLKANLF